MDRRIVLRMEYPPSINNYYGNHGGNRGRILKPKARAYRAAALGLTQRKLECLVEITITAYPPDERRRDIDNLAKPVLDAITFAKILPDDDRRHVHRVTVQWSSTCPGAGYVLVEISPVE